MKEKIYRKLAGLVPAKLAYFVFIRFWAHATCTDEGAMMTPDEMTWSKAIELWERNYGKI